MSIDRSQLSDSVQETRKADASRTGREPPAREDIEQFRNVMQARQEARDEFAAARGKGAGELGGSSVRKPRPRRARQSPPRQSMPAGSLRTTPGPACR